MESSEYPHRQTVHMHGTPKGSDPGPRPILIPESEIDRARYFRPPKALPVWVHLTYQDGSERDVMGFAIGWTRTHVYAQVPWRESYYEAVKDGWVLASQVRRRTIPGRR